jgi:histidine phosphotransferase ChpT
MNETRSAALELAERLAERLCHDISSAAQALASGLDLLTEARSEAERDEAAGLLKEALAAQNFKVAYARRVYGGGLATDNAELAATAGALYAELRPSLDWAVAAPSLGPTGSRALLLLVQIAADALALGGVVRATSAADGSMVAVELAGRRVTPKDEVRAGLAGAPFAAGLGGRWVQGAYLAALAAAAGGHVEAQWDEATGAVRVILPPGA